VQTCTKCNTQSSDSAIFCLNCAADLREFSTSSVALSKFRKNPRINVVRLVVDEDACPVCQENSGTYAKADVPVLPIPGCSNPEGCRCFYEPLLTEIYP
jgi:hypothetical protein